MLSLDELINKLIKIKKIPTLSPVASMLEQSLGQEEPNVQHVSRIISDDPSVTSMVLKVANSVMFGARRTISTVSDAVVRLGFAELSKIVFDLAVVKLLSDTTKGLLDPVEYWEHSIGVGYCMEIINERTDLLGGNGPAPHVVGLLHDLGRLISASYMPETYISISENDGILGSEGDIITLERKWNGLDHAQIGAAILELWGLPLPIVNCVRFHHEPDVAPRAQRKIAHLLNLADNLCLQKPLGDVGEGRGLELKESHWEFLGISSTEKDDILDRVLERLQKSQVLLSIGGLEEGEKTKSSSSNGL